MDDKNVKNEILEEYTHDVRTYMDTLKSIVIALCIVLFLMVGGLVAITVHHQNKLAETAKYSADKMVELMSKYDWEVDYEITSTDNMYWSGNVTIEQQK